MSDSTTDVIGESEQLGNVPANRQTYSAADVDFLLKSRIQALTALPTASKDLCDQYIMLIGMQLGYTKGHLYRCVGEFSVTEDPDPVSGKTYYTAQNVESAVTGLVEFEAGVTYYEGEFSWVDQNIGRVGLANVSNVFCIRVSGSSTASIRWTSPSDTVVDGVVLAELDKEIVVRNADHIPTNINDGTVVLTSTTRDAYKSTSFVDTGLATDHDTYYYKIFPVTKEGNITNDDVNSCTTSILTWNTIRTLLVNDEYKEYIKIGDVITLPAHDTYGTIDCDVVGYEDCVNIHDPNKTHGIVLHVRNLLTGAKQFDASEKYAVLTEDTTFQSGKRYGIKYTKTTDTAAVDGKTYYQLNSDWTVSPLTLSPGDPIVGDAYVPGTSATAYAKITVTVGDTVPTDTYTAWYELNVDTNRCSYGCNRWDMSGVRKYLNATALGQQWWTASTIWDVLPAYAGTIGFLGGFHDNEFLDLIAEVDNICQLPSIDGGGSVVCTDKVWLPSMWQLGDTSNNNLNEHTDPQLTAYIGITAANRRKRYKTNTTGFDYWWTRSAYTGGSYHVWRVYPSGSFNGYSYAHYTVGFAPCLVLAA